MDRVPLVGAALATFPAPRAMLLVSHRPQTLARCDRRLTSAGGKLLFVNNAAVGHDDRRDELSE
jgi:hypothetical protein